MPNRIYLRAFPLALATVMILLMAPEASTFCFTRAGRTYTISPRLLKAIARVESGLDPGAINQNRDGSYDCGLMQVNSRWQEKLRGNWQYLSEPCYNVMVGSWILRQCIDRYGYTWDAVACYHTGKGISELNRAKKERAITYVRKVREALRRKKQ